MVSRPGVRGKQTDLLLEFPYLIHTPLQWGVTGAKSQSVTVKGRGRNYRPSFARRKPFYETVRVKVRAGATPH